MTNQPTATLPPLFSIPEVAAWLKVSPKTVRRWIRRGDLTAHKIGRQIRVTEPDLLTFLRLRRQA